MFRSSVFEAGHTEKTPILGREQQQGCAVPKRWVLTLMGFFGFFNVYAMRVNLSVAMVAMTRKAIYTDLAPSQSIACVELLHHKPFVNSSSVGLEKPNGADLAVRFDWDASTQAIILGSFFYGYVITQIPGGIFAEKYGAKWLYGIGIFITSVFTLLTPAAALWGVWPLVLARVIEGLGEGVTYPAMNALIGRWAPKLERSRMASIIFNGSAVGNVFSFALAGIISDTIGWPYVFYVFGILGCIWTVFWFAVIYESPESHPHITKQEVLIIRRGQEVKRQDATIPWKAILTSRYVWALVITHFGQNWGFYTILTELPTYLSQILHFDLKKNGVLSAFPYLVQACLAIFASVIADKLRASGRWRINTIRKICNSIAFFVPAICVFLVGYVGCQPIAIVILLTLAMGFNGFMHSGFNVTHVDMSPDFAGTLMGITNCIANFAGFLAPAFVGVITESGQTLANWRIVFLTTSCVFVVSGFVYNIFCTAELQPWGIAKPNDNSSRDENEDNATTSIIVSPS